jgi:peptidoglycan/xylan/chitin deacetylase (PgdA/CDA1 family)
MIKATSPRKLIYVYSALFGITILASAAVIYILVVGNLLGRFSLLEDPYFHDLDIEVAVLDSDYSKKYLNTLKDKSFTNLSDVWVEMLEGLDIDFERVTDPMLEKGIDGFDVLVLPAAVCMSRQQRESVHRFLEEGNGVITTWAPGVRNEMGIWTGWDFMTELTGSRIWGETRDQEKGVGYFIFKGGEVLSSSIPPGFKIELGTYDTGILATNPRADSYYSNWRLEPIASPQNGSCYAAITHREFNGGRVVWYGFNLALPKRNRESGEALKILVENSIKYAARHPVSALTAWPLNEASAVIIGVDSERDFSNVKGAVDLFGKNEVPATFFCVSSMAEKHRDITRRITAIGEVASHGDRHEKFLGEPTEIQALRLALSKESLVTIIGKPIEGFRPPEEKFDESTIEATEQEEFRYIVANFKDHDGFDRAVPKLMGTDRNLVHIPRIGLDDYWLVAVDDSVGQGDSTAEESSNHSGEHFHALKRDFDRSHSMGGLYLMSLHSHLLSSPDKIGLLENIINYIKSKNVWIATSGEIARWWTMRDHIRIRTELVSWRRVALYISSLNEEIVENFSVRLSLPYHPKSISVNPELVNLPKPSYEVDSGDCMTIRVTDLLPYENRTYWIDLEYEEPSAQ